MATNDETAVVRNDDAGRYEIRIAGELAGFTEFVPDSEGRLRFPHTIVKPSFEGRGVGTTLIGEALADVARRGEVVVPLCPFVIRHLQQNEVPGLTVAWPAGVDAADAASPGEPA